MASSQANAWQTVQHKKPTFADKVRAPPPIVSAPPSKHPLSRVEVRRAVDPKPNVNIVHEAVYEKKWVDTQCTEGHVECEDSDVCVFKIRRTIPCRNEMKNPGSCPYETSCFFSHDFENAKPFNILDDEDRPLVICQHELRQPGSCRYGSRCFYSHNLAGHTKDQMAGHE